jgi:hypothetical protein
MGRTNRLVAALLLFSTPAVAQTYSVVWDPPAPAVAPALPAQGFNVYRNGLKIASVPSTTMSVVLTSPFLSDKVEVSAFAHDAMNAIVESARVQAASTDGTRVPPAGSITDTQFAAWMLGTIVRVAPNNYDILRNGTSVGFGQAIKLYMGTIYIQGDDATPTWYMWTGTAFNLYGTKEPGGSVVPPPPPPADVCVSTPLRISGLKWPKQAGSTSGSWNTNGFTVVSASFKWNPQRFEAVDSRGCTATVPR